MIAALWWKEWREQLGRWAPATVLLAGWTALLVSARLISIRETTAGILIFGGWMLSVVLIIAPLPSEKTHGTWPFLCALPIDRRRVLLAKWLSGAASITAMYAVTVLAGCVTALAVGIDAAWMAASAAPICVSMLAYHTLFFVTLPRARNELDAAMAALALAVITALWSIYATDDSLWIKLPGLLAPGAPMTLHLSTQSQLPPEDAPAAILGVHPVIVSTVLTALLWIAAPVAWLARPIARRDER